MTTLAKAKEVRPLVERCVTIAKKALEPLEAAAAIETDAERHSEAWKSWRNSDSYGQWNATVAPALAARRRLIQLLGNKEAVEILFDEIAPRFADRPGGYTRVLQLAKPRLGDAGAQAILEFVGVRDRVVQRAERPAFDDTEDETTSEVASTDAEESAAGTEEEKS